MKIQPLTLPQTNWPQLINFSKDVLGISPTRGLDANNISVKDPQAFLATLNFDNDPLNTVRNQSCVQDHVFVSFIADLDLDTVLDISTKTSLHVHTIKGIKRDRYLVILSGNLTQWRRAVLVGCLKIASTFFRKSMNIVMNHFESFGMKDTWCGYWI